MNKKNSPPRRIDADAGPFRFAVIVSSFNERITSRLLEGALACLREHKAEENRIRVYRCPGSFELPQVASKVAHEGWADAIVCLGAIVRGETPHFEYVSAEAARGVMHVALSSGIPVLFGVLTTNTVKQAEERAGGKHGNKGWDAALGAIEMAILFRK